MGADTVINGAPVEELLKLRVVTIKRNSVSNWLKILHPNTPVQEVLNLNDALNLIKSGNADVIVEDGAAIYPDMVSLVSLRIGVRPVPDLVTSLRFSVAQNEPKLVARLSNAMQNIPAITLSQLDSRWQNLELSSSGFLLSDQERQYLASLPVLKVAYDPDYRPVAFINKNGQEDGLAGEYWREIVAKLGLKKELVPATSWKQLLFKMASGQADVILPVKYVESDVGQVLYSRPMLSFSNVIVTSGLRVSNLAELNGKTLVVSDPVYLRDKLKALLPLSTINVTDSPLQAMQQVVDGNARAYVGNLLIITKLMIEHFSGTLQIVAPAEIPGDLSIGVTSRYESLLPLINRVLRTLTKEQREAMNTKWLYAAQQESVPWAAIKKTLWLALSGLVLLGVLLFISYRRLRIEINQRREAEHSLGDQLQLRDALIDTYPYPVVVKDVNKRYLLINHAYEVAFSINKQELLGRTTLETSHYPDDWSITIDELATQVMRKRENFHSEFSIANGQGEMRTWLYWMKPFYRANQALAGVMVSLVDITLIRQADEKAKSLGGCRQNHVVSRRASIRASANQTHASLTAKRRS